MQRCRAAWPGQREAIQSTTTGRGGSENGSSVSTWAQALKQSFQPDSTSIGVNSGEVTGPPGSVLSHVCRKPIACSRIRIGVVGSSLPLSSWCPACITIRGNGDAAVCTEAVPPTENPASAALQELAALAAAANLGDTNALKDLRRALDAHPEVWREAGDLSAHVEQTWLRLAAGGNALAEESIRLEADRITRSCWVRR